ncbi:MAG TPA: asparagine synthase-related protein, partial [Bacteroidales bacterium]|nr:asparagine synthase-related protein [Bacteroidales bacterium]
CADVKFYNRKELKNKLDINNNPEDAALLLHAFRKWGVRCVDYLIGDFAFAIWNAQKQELFCARDQIGIRPFYYCQPEKGFAFASEMNTLKAIYKDALTFNKEYYLDTLVSMISDKSYTAFKEIFRLPPAHYLIYRKGNIQIQKYWQLDPEQKIRYHSDDDYISHFFETLKNAVETRCEGVSNIGSELSGGLDSAAVTCIASKYADDNEITFTAFSNTLPENHNTVMKDEREYMLNVLEWKKMNWCNVNELKDSIPKLINHTLNLQGCFTQQRFNMFNKGIYEAAAQAGARILLSGFGGDEMVSARTGNAWNDLINEREWRHFYEALRYQTFLPKAVLKSLKILLKYQLKKNRQPGITSGKFIPRMLKRRFGNLPLQPQFAKENQLKERYFRKHERNAELYLAYRQLQKISHQHVPQRIEYSYAAAAYYGIQYRYPLLDIRLLQTCLSFPSWMKNRPGTDRYLFREALKGVIPEAIRLRADKTGAVIPHIYLRLKKDRELIMNFIQECSKDEYFNQIFDFSRFESWIDALLQRNPDEMNYLMPGAFYNYLMILSWFTRQKTSK